MKTRSRVEQIMERRGCHAKRRFRTEADAEREIALIRRSAVAADYEGVKPYHCPFCSRWHIGHPREPLGPAADAVSLSSGPDPGPSVLREALKKAGLMGDK